MTKPSTSFAPSWSARRSIAIWMLLFLQCALYPSPGLAREHRSSAEKRAFQREHPCPSTGQRRGRCPGYVIDHVVPLACGGPDLPSNMQWQTIAAGREKDRWERRACGK